MTHHSKDVFQALRSEIDRKLEEVKNSNSKISINQALILTCFQLAEDKYLLKQAINKNVDQLEFQTKTLLKDLGFSCSNRNFEKN